MNVVERLVGRLSPAGGSSYFVRDPPSDEPVSIQVTSCRQQLKGHHRCPVCRYQGPAAASLALQAAISMGELSIMLPALPSDFQLHTPKTGLAARCFSPLPM